jgi:ATP-binding cassette subfamily B protein
MLSPFLSGSLLFDEIIEPDGRWHALGPLFLCLGVIIGLSVLRFLARLVRDVLVARMMRQVNHDIRCQLFTKMQKMSLSFYTSTPMGHHFRLLSGDTGQVQNFFGGHIYSFVIYTVEFVGVLILLFLLNWKLSIGILVPVPILFFIYRRVFPKLRRLNIRAARENSAVETRITDSLNGIRVVKAFSKEREESEKLALRLDRLFRVNLKANMLSVILSPLIAFLFYAARQTIWGVGGFMVMGEQMSYGDFCTYLGYIGMVFAPLQFFSEFINIIGQSVESATRIVGMLESKPEIVECESPKRAEALRGEIEFSDVSFHYTPNRPILRGLTFRIEAGEHIGLVGRTGSGKSTIANLLLRMYDVRGGSIRVDGIDVREYAFDTLRRHVAIVSQEVHIFDASVADNIRFGRPEATLDEVIAAARAAGAHDFITALPEGYDTRVGGWGGAIGLSGGERQRLSIARAIVMHPSILILDEATAAMDNETEQRIAAAIAELVRGRTTISIAHRLSTLRDCDKIMSIENGCLMEMGTRAELLAKEDGIFKKLYTLQNDQMNKVMKGDTEDGRD